MLAAKYDWSIVHAFFIFQADDNDEVLTIALRYYKLESYFEMQPNKYVAEMPMIL